MKASGEVLRSHAPLLSVMVGYICVGMLILGGLERQVPLPLGAAYRIPILTTVVYLFATLLISIVHQVGIRRRAPLAAATWKTILGQWLPWDRLLAMLLVLAVLPMFIAVMLGFRAALTSFQPFAWDVRLMLSDRWLHGGHDPWMLLQPVLGHPAVTRFLDAFYTYGWFLVLWVGVAWQTVHGREPVRSQYLMTFALGWILLGTVAAIVFSSAGPVYFARVTEVTDPYLPMHRYLARLDAQRPLMALEVQEGLWRTYRDFGGVTAMPSLHLAQTTAVVLAAVRTDRRLGWLMGPILLLMLLGSIHLGWHYAVDGYAGILGTCGLWWLSGRLLRGWNSRTAPRARFAASELAMETD